MLVNTPELSWTRSTAMSPGANGAATRLFNDQPIRRKQGRIFFMGFLVNGDGSRQCRSTAEKRLQ
jgi:hypothetical protein